METSLLNARVQKVLDLLAAEGVTLKEAEEILSAVDRFVVEKMYLPLKEQEVKRLSEFQSATSVGNTSQL